MSEDNFVATQGQGNSFESPVSNGANADVQNSGQNQYITREMLDQSMKEILAKAYQQSQSLSDKASNRTASRVQAIIDDFRSKTGVTLTSEQAEQMAQSQAGGQSVGNNAGAMPMANAGAERVDPTYQQFLYYHGFNQPNNLTKKMFDVQTSFGVRLMADDPEYREYFGPDKKGAYKRDTDFLGAWRNALMDKAVRVRNSNSPKQAEPEKEKPANMGNLPLVGSQGKQAKRGYDPRRSGKSYINEYMKNKGLG